MRRFLRFVIILLQLSLFFLRAYFFKVITRNPVKCRQRLAKNTSYTARRMLKTLRMKVKIINPERLELLKKNNFLIVANHVSYTDILVLASCHPMIFITSLEMAANPVLGNVTRLGGSLYTNRKKRTTLPAEIERMSSVLQQGFNIVLFPEGTSTNGATVYPFKKSLFQTAIQAQKDILPICVKYKKLDGKPIITQQQRNFVCWYATRTFVPHLWELLKHKVDVEVHILEPVPYDQNRDRQQLSDEVHNRLLNTFLAS
ncbi:MAG: lysophospholipid acyltransferase family protein [Candidatus Cloacimonadaceae bacterium]